MLHGCTAHREVYKLKYAQDNFRSDKRKICFIMTGVPKTWGLHRKEGMKGHNINENHISLASLDGT